MKTNTLTISADRISITSKRGPLLILIVLFLLTLFLALLPPTIIVANVILGKGFHFGYLFAFVICWLPAYHLLKILLWNIAGKEVFKLSKNQIQYTAHYKFFIDGQKSISNDKLVFEGLNGHSESSTLQRIRISDAHHSIESVLEVPLTDLAEIERKIKSYYTRQPSHEV